MLTYRSAWSRAAVLALCAAAAAVFAGSASAQQRRGAARPTTRPAPRPAAQRVDSVALANDTARTPYDTSAFAALKWREIGPMRGGRSVAVAGSSSRPFEYWMGTTGGGVFKTTDGGLAWTPVTDKYFGGTIGSIGVSESNPDIVYVGTGEFPIRGNVSHGDGVYKTTDGGKTWTHLGLTETRQISRVIVHPTNPDLVYVGAQGHVWGPNPERGVFRTRDGGKTWDRLLFRNDSTGITDLEMDATNPNVLYAAFWQHHRKPWQLVSGGPGSSLYKTTDGGQTWQELTRNSGLPTGLWGNVGVAVSPARPNRVWALIEADSGGVFRSDDGGRTWTRLNDDRRLRQRAWYYTRIYADTRDSNMVYVSNVQFLKSTDGGRTFRPIRTRHSDSHDLWIAPNDNKRMVEGNDGGANVTINGGETWTEQDYATAQMYHVTTTNDFPYYVCGAQQDNSALCLPSRWPGGITMAESYDPGGCESGYIAVHPRETDISFAGCYGGYLGRMDRRTGFERAVTVWPVNPMGHSAGDLRYRFQWTYPIVFSPHDPNTLYVTGNVAFKSTNQGESWTPISGDLTRNDPRTLGPSGGPITRDQTSVEYYGTIFTFAESPVTAGVLWAGSDDGVIHVSRDAGKTWTNVTPQGLPEWARISLIDPSPHAAGTAYAAANRFQLDDMQPYLYRTTDYGRSWARIDSGIVRTEFTRAIREDPVRRGLLYAGTERGVWVSFNDGRHWQKLQLNLPPVPVHDLVVKDGDLVAGTHGRSFWILDDLSPLRQMTPQIASKDAHLFDPADTYRTTFSGGSATGASPSGENPPAGALVYYLLKSPAREVALEFLDSTGAVIRTFTSRQDSVSRLDSLRVDSLSRIRADSLTRAGVHADTVQAMRRRGEEELRAQTPQRLAPPPRVGNRAGLNRFAWNLRHPDASAFEGMILWAGGVQGPLALPGTYRVRMAVDGQPAGTQSFTVRKDPRSPATLADLRQQFALLVQIRDRLSEANDAVKTIRHVKYELRDRERRLRGADSAAFARLAAEVAQRLSIVEDSIYQTRNRSGQDPLNYPIRLNNQISALAGVVASTEARPTTQAREAFRMLSSRLDEELGRMRRVLDESLPRANEMLRRANLAEIVPRAAEVPGGQVAAGGGE